MERRAKMESAFEPVPGNMEISEGGMDLLSTTPAALSAVIEAVLGAYDSKGAGTMIGEAAGLMDPQVIGRLREMQRILRKNFL